MLHTLLRLRLVPKGLILVRTQNLLLIAVGVSAFKLFLALIHPRLNPPQLIEIISLEGVDCIGVFERLALHRGGSTILIDLLLLTVILT